MNIDDIIKISPKSLPNSPEVGELGNFYLPYITGFEIETSLIDNSFDKTFRNIPNLLHYARDWDNEIKFKIPSGINGLICLESITEVLKEAALFNVESGIHYHIDFTEDYDKLSTEFIAEHSNEILKELDTWEYKGTYNPRRCEFSYSRNWTRFKESIKTMEFRIGEMTFDYELLFKRITHCNSIVRKLKNRLNKEFVEESEYNFDAIELIKNREVIITL